MIQNGPKWSNWSKMVQNDLTQSNVVQSHPKLFKFLINCLKWFKTVLYVPIWFKLVQKDPKGTKNCPKWSNIVQYGPKSFKFVKMVQNALKW